MIQNNSVHEYKETHSQRLLEKKEKISKSESSLATNFQYGNRIDKNLQNKAYLLNFEKEVDERDLAIDVKNLSIDEKLSTKKIHKMLNNDYKFFHKASENQNYQYEVPENERFQRVKMNQHKELKKSAVLPFHEVIKEKTEENFIEPTEASVLRVNFDSMKGLEQNASKFNSLQMRDFNLRFLKKYSGHKNSINAMAYDCEAKKLWSCSHDYSIKVMFLI